MKLLYKLVDDQFPKALKYKDRLCGRAIILNDKNEVCMLHLLYDDIFGHRDYYETPGGGVKPNETPLLAALREASEEIGAICDLISEIGIVDDYYNLIGWHNLSHYYLLRAKGFRKPSLEDYEKLMLHSIIWKPIDEAIELIENVKETPISILIKRRELPIYKMVRDTYLKK